MPRLLLRLPVRAPHEFAVNVPEALSRLRVDTYADHAWPRALSGLYRNNPLLAGLVTAVCVALAFVLTLVFQGSSTLFSSHYGDGAFFAVMPYGAMVLPATVMLPYSVFALLAGFVSFWRRTCGDMSDLINPSAFVTATKDAFGLQYLKGGGDGCNYPTRNSPRAECGTTIWYSMASCWTSPRPPRPPSSTTFLTGNRPIPT